MPQPSEDPPLLPRITSPHRETSHHAMPYCASHNRLYPHAYVGWLTPAGIAGLHLLPRRCDVCEEEQRHIA